MPSLNLNKPIKIGIDFDNTIVCYDSIFQTLARERKIQLTGKSSVKTELRDALRNLPNGELEWTKIQAEVYGPRIFDAKPYPGVLECFAQLNKSNIPFCIISHKTRYPVLGTPHDLHEWAIHWLARNDLSADGGKVKYFFELTKEAKIERIRSECCSHFIDDLPEFLNHSSFPTNTQKIWFNPARDPAAKNSLIPVTSWNQIKAIIPELSSIGHCSASVGIDEAKSGARESIRGQEDDETIASAVSKLLNDVIVGSEKLGGGANNRAFKLSLKSGKSVFVKKYFYSEYDTRERLNHEYDFLTLLDLHGIHKCPKPIAKDDIQRIGIYEYKEGHSFPLGTDIPDHVWEDYLNFLMQLQDLRGDPLAASLPPASEASYSLDSHLAKTRKRRDEWLTIVKQGNMDSELIQLVTQDLEDAYEEIADEVFSFKDFRSEIASKDRILSPSDFGVHNLLVNASGELTFVDFEYAGWDDPAKTVSDFFFQPRYPAPSKWIEPFLLKLASVLDDEHEFLQRYPIVRRCIGLKWCYILLNDFHPEAGKRRSFAAGSTLKPVISDRVLEVKNRLQQLKTKVFVEIEK